MGKQFGMCSIPRTQRPTGTSILATPCRSLVKLQLNFDVYQKACQQLGTARLSRISQTSTTIQLSNLKGHLSKLLEPSK